MHSRAFGSASVLDYLGQSAMLTTGTSTNRMKWMESGLGRCTEVIASAKCIVIMDQAGRAFPGNQASGSDVVAEDVAGLPPCRCCRCYTHR